MGMITMGLGDDGSGLEIAVISKTRKIPISIREVETISVSTNISKAKIIIKNPIVKVNSIPKLKFNIKECNG